MLAQGLRGIGSGELGACANSLRGAGRTSESDVLECEVFGAHPSRLRVKQCCARTGESSVNRDDVAKSNEVIAARLVGATDAEGFPPEKAWDSAAPVRFDADWRGLNADAERGTEVRLLWTPETLYLRFVARYRNVSVFPDADARGWRDHLWDRDVCEVFLQPDAAQVRRYLEFEVAPNGFWIDLGIGPGEKHDLRSGMRRRVGIDEAAKRWTAVLALPMKSLTERFDAAAAWRVNFFRVEGDAEPRFYSAWRATGTPQPNFHVPEVFGRLVFGE
jgi:alpha-galactosidase